MKLSEREPPCFLCDSGTLRIFVTNGVTRLDHSVPLCLGFRDALQGFRAGGPMPVQFIALGIGHLLEPPEEP